MTGSSWWRPFHVRVRGKSDEHDALVDGVPGWLAPALIDWLTKNFIQASGYPPDELLRAMQVKLRVEKLDWRDSANSAYRSFLERCFEEPDLLLSALDYALLLLGTRGSDEAAIDALEGVLEAGGSKWRVAPDRLSLVERVIPEAVEAVRHIIDSGKRAGKHLAEAWRHVYGRNPHAGTAYREAVRAIEAAVCPVIIPKDPKGTLGKAIIALRDAPSGKFVTAFEDTGPNLKSLDAVRGLMELVWTSQLDRHGSDDESVPLHVSQEQGEAALHAAVTLVQWFQRGVVRLA